MTKECSHTDAVLGVITKINIVLRRNKILEAKRRCLLEKMRDSLVCSYQNGQSSLAKNSLTFLTANRILSEFQEL